MMICTSRGLKGLLDQVRILKLLDMNTHVFCIYMKSEWQQFPLAISCYLKVGAKIYAGPT